LIADTVRRIGFATGDGGAGGSISGEGSTIGLPGGPARPRRCGGCRLQRGCGSGWLRLSARSGRRLLAEAFDRRCDHAGSRPADRAVEIDPRLAELATDPDRHRLPGQRSKDRAVGGKVGREGEGELEVENLVVETHRPLGREIETAPATRQRKAELEPLVPHPPVFHPERDL